MSHSKEIALEIEFSSSPNIYTHSKSKFYYKEYLKK